MGKVKTYSGLFVAAALGAIVPPAHGGPLVEVGGYGGGTSTTVHETFNCPPDTDPLWPCVTEAWPHDGSNGVAFGLYVRFPVLRAVELEANLMYAQKGYGGDNPVRIHYLEAPIMVRVDPFRDWSHARVFAYAGLAPALDLWCHESGTRFDNDTHQAVPYSDSCGTWPFDPRSPKRFDLGGVAGGGVGWAFSFGVVELQGRWVEGLVDTGLWGGGGKTMNRAFYVLGGYGRTFGGP